MRCYHIKDRMKSELPLSVEKEFMPEKQQVKHVHDCIELMVVRSGAGWCSVNGKRFPMVCGDLYLMGEHDIHDFYIKHESCYYTIMFKKELFNAEELAMLETFPCFSGIREQRFAFSGKLSISPSAQPLTFECLDKIREELSLRNSGFTFYAKALLLQFLIGIARDAHAAQIFDDRKSQISSIMDYVSKHYHQPITLESIAGGIGGNPEYLGRLFKHRTGSNISQYIAIFRIDKARIDLENKNLSLTEIAYQNGFFDSSHFTRTFKNITGLTPLEYRKLLLKDN